jgi:hypothetical protein
VDTNSVSVLIDGTPPAKTFFFGDPSSYAVICDPDGALPAGSLIQVVVTAADIAPPPSVTTSSWSFTTEGSGPDVEAPLISGMLPADAELDVPRDTDIFFVLSDVQSGVDTNSVAVLIDGTPPARTSFYGISSSYSVVCELANPLPANATVNVGVTASDLASSPNLLSASWGFTTRDTASATPDTDPPTVSGANPADGAMDVPRDTEVFFVLSDAQSGVDTNSVAVLIDGVAPARTSFYGVSSSYAIVCELANPLPASATVSVGVTASDLASSPNPVTASWSFTTSQTVNTTDVTSPVFYYQDPAPNALNVDPNSSILVRVRDDMAIDPLVVEFYYNGALVPATITITDTLFRDAAIEFDNTGAFVPGSVVQVRVTACDRSSNCATLDYSFTVSSPAGLAGASASIVPDGFWADDRDRPLEVRNIPLKWTVRIFDTAGIQVRAFENVQGAGMDWVWDFTNDEGSRVVKSLYLVRVVDEDGVVRQSGRFVVQSE